ncbi:hypothetical protein ILUMI_17935 [Ignelater luminosus]|uniref:Glucose-methanol-choline oxidoreductase N-terminal domain-containing protein n=1 Tax=Ignelater luminosus TaxID=2038154 RepID=A0A8K0G7F3_IGNLU|nr:hypothetical protein ILUMI_17935 [Ignelater luminosus]
MEPCKTCCLGLKGGTCDCPRGKALGGSSVINVMLYVRGNPSDYYGWAEDGNTEWNYSSVVTYFRKFEGCQDPDCPFYGKDGELKLTRYKFQQPIRDILANAYSDLGYYKEYTEENPLGFWDTFMTINEGTRFGKLIIDTSEKVVRGVEVKINGKILKFRAKKEVILSAGAISSPQILMNSGIGPKKHLEDIGIRVVKDLNVGNNFQDHVIFPLFLSIDNSVVNPKSTLDEINQYYNFFMHRYGPLTEIGITNFLGFLNIKNDSIYPDLQFYHVIFEQNDSYLLPTIASAFDMPDELIATFQESNRNSCNLFIAPQILKPKSRGKIRLRSADPFDSPKIFPNYFSDKDNEDLDLLLEGIKLVKQLIQTKTLRKYNAKLVEYTLPNCKEFVFDTTEFWRCAIRNIGNHIYHQAGTCKMGPKGDPTAVVSPRLRVHEIQHLRVIDASIMPRIISGNLNAPVIMIGEKGAEFIKQAWLPSTHN